MQTGPAITRVRSSTLHPGERPVRRGAQPGRRVRATAPREHPHGRLVRRRDAVREARHVAASCIAAAAPPRSTTACSSSAAGTGRTTAATASRSVDSASAAARARRAPRRGGRRSSCAGGSTRPRPGSPRPPGRRSAGAPSPAARTAARRRTRPTRAAGVDVPRWPRPRRSAPPTSPATAAVATPTAAAARPVTSNADGSTWRAPVTSSGPRPPSPPTRVQSRAGEVVDAARSSRHCGRRRGWRINVDRSTLTDQPDGVRCRGRGGCSRAAPRACPASERYSSSWPANGW